MLSDYLRVRPLLNLNATSVKAITSFIIAKTSWNTLPVLQRAAEIRSYKLNCLRSSSYVSSKCTSGQCKICQAKHWYYAASYAVNRGAID